MPPAEQHLLRILVVEDSADAQLMLCDLLTLLGHEPAGAGDAAIALEMLGSQNFDVLLTDINLLGMSGVHLARKAKAVCPNIKVIFATGHDDSMSSYIGFPTVWLTKPYEVETLVQALEQPN